MECESGSEYVNLRTINRGITTASSFSSVVSSAVGGNPMILIGTLETSQTLSHLMYVNKPNSYNLDQTF